MKLLLYCVCLVFVLGACRGKQPADNITWRTEQIQGRNQQPVYTLKVPSTWKRVETTTLPLTDTRTPLVTYVFGDEGDLVTVTIHNFPLDQIEDQIPPLAQVERWKRQFEKLIPEETEVKPVAFAGYVGLSLRGHGFIKGRETLIEAWSLQMAPEHFGYLSHPESKSLHEKYNQMKGDVTIKIVGPGHVIIKHQPEIDKVIASFHLIEEIPAS